MTVPADDGLDFFAPAPSRAPQSNAPGRMAHGASSPAVPPIAGGKPSRWVKSDTTFGPVGRLVATVMLLIPFTFLVASGLLTFDPFVLGGAGIWAVIMAMGLRQVWQIVQPHHRR